MAAIRRPRWGSERLSILTQLFYVVNRVKQLSELTGVSYRILRTRLSDCFSLSWPSALDWLARVTQANLLGRLVLCHYPPNDDHGVAAYRDSRSHKRLRSNPSA